MPRDFWLCWAVLRLCWHRILECDIQREPVPARTRVHAHSGAAGTRTRALEVAGVYGGRESFEGLRGLQGHEGAVNTVQGNQCKGAQKWSEVTVSGMRRYLYTRAP